MSAIMDTKILKEHSAGSGPTGTPIGKQRLKLTSVLLAVVFSSAACAYFGRDVLGSLFGPPAVVQTDAYTEDGGGSSFDQSFDHAAFDALLKKHVSADGWVEYDTLLKDVARLDAYIATLADAPFDDLGRSARLALLINAYNAFTLRLILDFYPIESIRDIPKKKRWDHKRWKLAGRTLSLDAIEHQEIRPRFSEPRIHFALVCAAVGCPKLRNEAYVADRLEAQLADQMRYCHQNERWFRFSKGESIVRLTRLYDWYGDDFKQVAGSVVKFVAGHSEDLTDALAAGKSLQIEWLEYDWKLNHPRNAR